ncbi:hypothetical protein LSTR_LSTR009086 [Laodelphax striatellus]|uniref:Phospholipase A2-like domain-containing protein n=1 Tax=Laodelphax striatellus TaxID=195883 RepID=A0A482XPW1_LAOST|nr:hypothetical protein LSTR_LSTR009086 [Laodelphax striatellus]
MNFPWHRYLGPGNPSSNGRPVDKDDEIAKQHDIDYDTAANNCDVRSADRRAIGNFLTDVTQTYNWHSVVGALGLGVKYAAESFVGVRYPGGLPSCSCFPDAQTLANPSFMDIRVVDADGLPTTPRGFIDWDMKY